MIRVSLESLGYQSQRPPLESCCKGCAGGGPCASLSGLGELEGKTKLLIGAGVFFALAWIFRVPKGVAEQRQRDAARRRSR